MRRIDGWQRALVAWANAQVGRPLVWGETDCHALVREAARVMYGADLFADVAPWGSRFAALRRLARGEDVMAALLAHGWLRSDPTHVIVGDVVVGPPRNRFGLRPTAVVVGFRVLLVADEATQTVKLSRHAEYPVPDTYGVRLQWAT